MSWSTVGEWIKGNAGTGAALVGSLLTGNIPGAVAAGVAMVSSATGQATPEAALATLQQDPATVVRLRELALQDEASVREHIRAMTEAALQDAQAEHRETQETIRSGDNSTDPFVRRTRPAQAWCSLLAGIGYVAWREAAGRPPDGDILMILLALAWAYAGLRQIGKGVDVLGRRKAAAAAGKG